VNALKDFDQRRWDRDIARYQRAIDLAAIVTSPRVKAILREQATEIQARYPRYIRPAAELSPPGDK